MEQRVEKAHSLEIKEKAIAMMLISSLSQVSRDLNIPKATLCRWKKEFQTSRNSETALEKQNDMWNALELKKEEIEKVREEKLKSFADASWNIVVNSLNELNDRIERMRNDIADIQELKRFILDNKDALLGADYPKDKILALFTKLESLNAIKTSELTMMMGICYDKHTLASGGATERIVCSFEEMPE